MRSRGRFHLPAYLLTLIYTQCALINRTVSMSIGRCSFRCSWWRRIAVLYVLRLWWRRIAVLDVLRWWWRRRAYWNIRLRHLFFRWLFYYFWSIFDGLGDIEIMRQWGLKVLSWIQIALHYIVLWVNIWNWDDACYDRNMLLFEGQTRLQVTQQDEDRDDLDVFHFK